MKCFNRYQSSTLLIDKHTLPETRTNGSFQRLIFVRSFFRHYKKKGKETHNNERTSKRKTKMIKFSLMPFSKNRPSSSSSSHLQSIFSPHRSSPSYFNSSMFVLFSSYRFDQNERHRKEEKEEKRKAIKNENENNSPRFTKENETFVLGRESMLFHFQRRH